jgi:hypothetical protein
MDEISLFTNSGDFPLKKSAKQFIRVAVQEFLHVIRRLNPMPGSHQAMIDIGNFLNATAEITYGYESTFEHGRTRIEQLRGIGAENEARKLVHDLMVLAKKIPVSELSAKYYHRLEVEYRQFLKAGAKKVKTNVKQIRVARKKKRRHENGG